MVTVPAEVPASSPKMVLSPYRPEGRRAILHQFVPESHVPPLSLGADAPPPPFQVSGTAHAGVVVAMAVSAETENHSKHDTRTTCNS